MAYILVKPEVLKSKGYDIFDTMPDGRAIAETNLLKVLGSVKEVEIVSTTKELEIMIAKQKKELGTTPQPEWKDETPQGLPQDEVTEIPSEPAPQEEIVPQESAPQKEVIPKETKEAADNKVAIEEPNTNAKKVK